MQTMQAIAAALATATTHEDIRPAVHAITQLAGMENFALLRFRGGRNEHLVQVVHTAPASHAARFERPDYWHASPIVRAQLAGPTPAFYGDNTHPDGAPGFEHGLAVNSAEDRGSIVLILARTAPAVSPAEKMEAMRMAYFGMPAMGDALRRLHLAACPLSSRQIDCLRYHLAGHTAAETGRALQLGTRTVEEYLVRAREHLQASNSLAAAVLAIDHGWISLPEVSALMTG